MTVPDSLNSAGVHQFRMKMPGFEAEEVFDHFEFATATQTCRPDCGQFHFAIGPRPVLCVDPVGIEVKPGHDLTDDVQVRLPKPMIDPLLNTHADRPAGEGEV